MKKILLLIVVFSLFLMPSNVLAEEVHVYLFYGNTCSICEAEREFLKNKDDVKVHEFEVYNNKENYDTMKRIKELYGISKEGVPFTVVGDTAILGFNASRQNKINRLVTKYSDTDYYDRVGVFLGLYQDEELVENEEVKNEEKEQIKEEKKDTNFFWIYFGIIVIILLVINIIKNLKRVCSNVKK